MNKKRLLSLLLALSLLFTVIPAVADDPAVPADPEQDEYILDWGEEEEDAGEDGDLLPEEGDYELAPDDGLPEEDGDEADDDGSDDDEPQVTLPCTAKLEKGTVLYADPDLTAVIGSDPYRGRRIRGQGPLRRGKRPGGRLDRQRHRGLPEPGNQRGRPAGCDLCHGRGCHSDRG